MLLVIQLELIYKQPHVDSCDQMVKIRNKKVDLWLSVSLAGVDSKLSVCHIKLPVPIHCCVVVLSTVILRVVIGIFKESGKCF